MIITDNQPRGLGYIEIDQRAVPGELPVGTPRHFEADTYTCSHCNRVVVVNHSRVRERYKCSGCNHHVCDDCAARRVAGGPCRTMKQYVDESLEAAARQLPQRIILPWEANKE